MKRSLFLSFALVGLFAFTVPSALAQDEAAAPAAEAAAAAAPAAGNEITETAPAPKQHSEFYTVLFGSGAIGFFLWVCLFSCLGAYIYLAIDCGILVRPSKIMPTSLIANVQAAMKEGDVVKALSFCENEPTPMSNILSAGFTHVEEGFDIIQEAISAAADLEVERLMQHLSWLSVCAAIAPQLGLLGTVQGMILTFATIAIQGVEISSLSMTISQALYTTAGGLVVAIPAITFFYALRNTANRLVLRMQVVTSDLIKNLRNVEVVEE